MSSLMTPLLPRPATLRDLEDLPEGVTGEIIAGTLYVWPRPAPRHATAETEISSDLSGPYGRGRGGPGGWLILIEPELHLRTRPDESVPDVVVPDVAGWRRARLPALPDTAFIDVVPDWICEVLSPRNRAHDRITKLQCYARHGVGWAWIVDPEARSVEVFENIDGVWALQAGHEGDTTARLPPFDAVELELAWWWGERPAGSGEE